MARTIIPLNDPKQWQFRQADESTFPWLRVSRMPTNVHLDLLHHGIIAHPFIGKNEIECQWVGECAWIYKGVFPMPDLTFGDKAVLAFDGLDTYATVKLNGKEILKTEDMFVPERVNVTLDVLLGENNVLEIHFDSTYLIGKKLVEQQPEHRWGCWNGDPSRLAVRKAQYHYGWDWGPALLTCGPWRPISIEIYTSRIADLYFTTDVDESLRSAEVVAKADIEGDGNEVHFEISIDGKTVGAETVNVEDSLATATFRNYNPKLWYPHTYGEQPLYVLEAKLLKNQTIVDKAGKKFGLRRAEVVQRKLDHAAGSTFLFRINNIPLFCGGSNWIPGEILGTMSPQKYHDWITAIVEGNQVMLRVWGGGIYEDTAFYDACDELGLLVWQDFLFACGNYPANDEFLALVKREAVENVKLMRHHPCIVIFAGNNEDYAYRETENLEYNPGDPNPTSWLNTDFPARYIYELILADIMKELLPQTYYHFGSPYSGTDSSDPQAGDIHQWNVWHGSQEKYQDFDKLVGRFVSEFGMEAFPSIATVDSYLPKGLKDIDRYPQSSTVDFHNKAAGQERRLALYLAENIPTSMEPFEQYIYCTQLMQAECVANAYKVWKRQWKGPGREHCSGALVWQANDCWPCTSWSIMDYYLRPKMAYFAIKRELRHITVGLKRTVKRIPADKYTRANIKTVHKIEMWACNLSLADRDLQIEVKSHNLITHEQTSWHHLKSEIRLEKNRSTEIAEFEVPVVGSNADIARASTIYTTSSIEEQQQQTVVAAYLYDLQGEQVARAVSWPEPLKHAHLPKSPDIKIRLTTSQCHREEAMYLNPETIFRPEYQSGSVMVSTNLPVKGFVLEVGNSKEQDMAVRFEDNGIDLMPGESLHVPVKGLHYSEQERLRFRYLGM